MVFSPLTMKKTYKNGYKSLADNEHIAQSFNNEVYYVQGTNELKKFENTVKEFEKLDLYPTHLRKYLEIKLKFCPNCSDVAYVSYEG